MTKSIDEVFEELWPGSSAEARDCLIWLTPYPFVSAERIIDSLTQMRAKWGSRIGDAIQGEHDEFDRLWEETRPQREADIIS
jgi:hypothetical protein